MIRRESSTIKLDENDLAEWQKAKQAIINEKQQEILNKCKGSNILKEQTLQNKIAEKIAEANKRDRIGLK
jgi:hypothetical protein